MKKLVYFTSILFILSYTNCSKTDALDNEVICQDSENLDLETSDLCTPKVMSYHFGLENLNPSQKVTTLYNLGMDGMLLEIDDDSINTLNQYFLTNEVINNEFQIYDIFTRIDVDNSYKLVKQLERVERIYRKIQCQKTRLQVLFHGTKGNSNIPGAISRISDIAKKYSKELIIYPHAGLAITSAEEALTYINQVAKDNVFLSVHLSHELAAGNHNRINEVIANVSPYIRSASISGATISESINPNLPPFYWALKPLTMGDYEYSEFYNSLYNNNYNGPIAIHTWGLLENFELHPNQYLPQSKTILYNLGLEVCN